MQTIDNNPAPKLVAVENLSQPNLVRSGNTPAEELSPKSKLRQSYNERLIKSLETKARAQAKSRSGVRAE